MAKTVTYDTSCLDSEPNVRAAMDEAVHRLWTEPFYWSGSAPDLELAKAITRIKITKGYGWTRLGPNVTVKPIEELRGVMGEMAFAAKFGLRAEFIPPSWSTDGGRDFIWYGQRIDIKSVVNPTTGVFIRWKPRSTADIYVTILFDKTLLRHIFVGWAWYQDIMVYGSPDHFNREYLNKPAQHLRPGSPYIYPIDTLETSLILGDLEMSYKKPHTEEAPTLSDVKEGKPVPSKPQRLTEADYAQNKGLEKITEATDHPEEDETAG